MPSGDAGSYSSSFNMTNNCSYTVWPAISSGAGSAALETMGFQLRPSQWKLVAVPYAWTGQVWGRTLCSTDSITGRFTCVTGDCGTGCEDCVGGGAAAPITLAQFQTNGVGGRDSYVVTVVDGFNIPMMVAPPPGAGGDDDRVPSGPQRRVPARSARHVRHRRPCCVHECVSGVRLARVLLHRRARGPEYLYAVRVLGGVQASVSAGDHLPVRRRRQLHLFMRRRRGHRHHVRHHVLPQH